MSETALEMANRLTGVSREIRQKFDAYALEVRDEIQIANLTGNSIRASMLEAGLKIARRDILKIDEKLSKVLLSTSVVDALVSELNEVNKEANKLLKDLQQLKNAFERVEQVANLISKALSIVSKFA